MNLNLLSYFVLTGFLVHGQAQANCPQEEVKAAVESNTAIMQFGPLTGVTTPYAWKYSDVSSSVLDGSMVLTLGSKFQHSIQLEINAQGERAWFFGRDARQEALEFVNIHCHKVEELRGVYYWDNNKQMFVNQHQVGLKVNTFENALGQNGQVAIDFVVTPNRKYSGVNLEGLYIVELEDLKTLGVETRFDQSQFRTGLGPTDTQKRNFESLPPVQALAAMSDLMSEPLQYADANWMGVAVENLRKANPEYFKSEKVFESPKMKKILRYIVFQAGSSYTESDPNDGRVAATHFLVESLNASNLAFILERMPTEISKDQVVSQDKLNNYTYFFSKTFQSPFYSAELKEKAVVVMNKLISTLNEEIKNDQRKINETTYTYSAETYRTYDEQLIKHEALLAELNRVRESFVVQP